MNELNADAAKKICAVH